MRKRILKARFQKSMAMVLGGCFLKMNKHLFNYFKANYQKNDIFGGYGLFENEQKPFQLFLRQIIKKMTFFGGTGFLKMKKHLKNS